MSPLPSLLPHCHPSPVKTRPIVIDPLGKSSFNSRAPSSLLLPGKPHVNSVPTLRWRNTHNHADCLTVHLRPQTSSGPLLQPNLLPPQFTLPDEYLRLSPFSSNLKQPARSPLMATFPEKRKAIRRKRLIFPPPNLTGCSTCTEESPFLPVTPAQAYLSHPSRALTRRWVPSPLPSPRSLLCQFPPSLLGRFFLLHQLLPTAQNRLSQRHRGSRPPPPNSAPLWNKIPHTGLCSPPPPPCSRSLESTPLNEPACPPAHH